MTDRMLLVGDSSFESLRKLGGYYVDKTAFIKPLFDDGNLVSLVTRPRRFGKTLMQRTLQAFFEERSPQEHEVQAALFSGLAVSEDKAFFETHFGRWPVLFVSFKEFNGITFDRGIESLARIVSEVAQMLASLREDPKLPDFLREAVRRLIDLQNVPLQAQQKRLPNSLKTLVTALSEAAGGRQVIVLIDEYDVPLNRARTQGYYADLLPVMREMLEGALKDNCRLRKGIVTGCLRIAKESVFTGLNHFGCHTVSDNALAEAIGFTPREAAQVLADFGLSEHAEAVRRHYDGYRFGDQEIYCPWDLMSFCRDAAGASDVEYRNYWIHTSGNDLMTEFLHYADESHLVKLRELLAGGTVEARLEEELSFAEIDASHDADHLMSLLYCTGYLTKVGRLADGSACLKIPNEEVRASFERQTAIYFSDKGRDYVNVGRDLARYLKDGNGPGANEVLQEFLARCASVRDFTSENSYHMLMLGLLGGALRRSLDSNRESGDGYSDIRFLDAETNTAVILELKRAETEKTLTTAARAAIEQIHERRYYADYELSGVKKMLLYGMAFCGKRCFTVMEVRQPGASR